MLELEDDRRKLANATNSLARLKSLLTSSSDNCVKMVETLTKFDDRLLKLEETVQPVYKETGNLQRQQENINFSLKRLDYVIKFYTVAGEVEPNIINGPGSSSMYADYIADLNRLTEAVRYFEHNNRESPELMNCGSLLEKGGQIIEKEFRQNMSRHSEEIKKVDIILDMIKANGPVIQKQQQSFNKSIDNNNDDQESEKLPSTTQEPDLYKVFKLADRRNGNPEKILHDLKLLAEWLCHNRNQDFVQLYSRLRSDVLSKSLNNLRSYLKSSTLGSMINMLGAHLSPLLGGRKNLHLMKRIDISTATLSSYDSKDLLDLNITEPEIFAYVLTVTGLLKLMQLELALIERIIPVDNQKIIFSRVILLSLESAYHEGEQLSTRVKRSVQKQDFSSALFLLPVLRYHAYMRHSFDLLLDGCDSQVSHRLHSLVVTLQTTISKTLEEFIEYIKSDQHHHRVPKDGTVHELTSNVMLFLVHLQSYLDILSRVVTVTDIQSLELSGDKNRIAFAQYIWRVLSAMGLSLRKRSESYHNEPSLQSLFLLNNTFYILKTLTTSSLLSIVSLYRSNVRDDYQAQIHEFKMGYYKCWNKVIHYIDEINNPTLLSPQRSGTMSSSSSYSTLPNSHSSYSLSGMSTIGSHQQQPMIRLKDKDRQIIKDKFAGFNKEFETVIQSHRSYAIPDRDLREEIKKELIQWLNRIYFQFYERYVAVEFTKNVHKYIKYTPDHVSQSICLLFDELA
ncbi:exocyst complex component 7 [Dermatophagoides pteronyssinus]|uniref:Exocyst complex component 7 n=2 Tax=Dermatophagoides pteronyssinus TaxID=6956 RepID=A0A6P6Y923_DERPT|nr:exocyst complex component 7-like [Dermatophagoides pteronyssinus]KAH9422650.1 Exocyst complex component 7 [Dermatophagoides pteronyssinus]